MINAGLPNITGHVDGYMNMKTTWSVNNAITIDNISTGYGGNEDGYYHALYFDASKSNSIYGNSTTVQPLSLTAIYAIKY